MRIRPIQPDDLEFVRGELVRHWNDVGIWSVGKRYQADELPGFIAIEDGETSHGAGAPPAASPSIDSSGAYLGLVTYFIHPGGWQGEVITLSSCSEDHGVGTALLEAATQAICAAGCRRAFLTTTNDNLRAIGFYQKRGWSLAALHKGIIDQARVHGAEIPPMGLNGIPLRDEVELERWLDER